MGKYFGTDGIRGPFGCPVMNPQFAYRMGAALSKFLATKRPGMPLNIVIGRDTRMSGPALADALTLGFNQAGAHVWDCGIVPTPAVAQNVVEQSADLGIAITASHNPAADNGIKLFDGSGFKFDATVEAEIEALLDAEPPAPKEMGLPRAYPLDGASFYINYQRSLLDQNCMSGWKIVLDTANGATAETSPAVFRRWNAKLKLLGDNPNGENINAGCGSESPERMSKAVTQFGADLGIAHDGDGDRLVVCDETGQLVDGDILLGIFAVYALRSKALSQKTLVTTVHSNLGLDHAVRAAGGDVVRVDVGDRNVAKKMREIGSNLGGESSGHIIFSNFSTTGDGLLAATKLIELMCKTGKRLSELCQEVTLFPQMTRNLKVTEKRSMEKLSKLKKAITRIEADLGEHGRVLVRYSGTEPKIRLLIEGPDGDTLVSHMKTLEKAVRSDLKVIEG